MRFLLIILFLLLILVGVVISKGMDYNYFINFIYEFRYFIYEHFDAIMITIVILQILIVDSILRDIKNRRI